MAMKRSRTRAGYCHDFRFACFLFQRVLASGRELAVRCGGRWEGGGGGGGVAPRIPIKGV